MLLRKEGGVSNSIKKGEVSAFPGGFIIIVTYE
jgi:hypothetical protein